MGPSSLVSSAAFSRKPVMSALSGLKKVMMISQMAKIIKAPKGRHVPDQLEKADVLAPVNCLNIPARPRPGPRPGK